MDKDKRPLLTIAVPTYNGEKTIRNLFNLLLPQCISDIEVLISDNCSTDDTPKIVDQYCKKYPFIKMVRNQKNIGPDANFLQCMRLASGKFTWLISDDDVVIEGAIDKILCFLKRYPNVSLIYASTVDFRGHYEGVEKCSFHRPILSEDICTTDKKVFINYAGYYWGFMSSFICSTNAFRQIKMPERFFGTYWLQSYIHAMCAKDTEQMGLIKGPCIGAGIYVNTSNFDSSLVNGIYYRELINFMISEGGFDKKQLERLYRRRICHLSRHDIIKEKSSGVYRINKKQLIHVTRKYPEAWLTVYPLMCVPPFICRAAMGVYKRSLRLTQKVSINRPE